MSQGTPENVEDKCEDGFEQGKNTPASGQRRRQQSRRHIFRRGLGHFCALIYSGSHAGTTTDSSSRWCLVASTDRGMRRDEMDAREQ